MRLTIILAAVITLALTGLPAASLAQSTTAAERTTQEKRSIRYRLVTAGRQRMLAERLAAKLCLLEGGLRTQRNWQEFYVAWNIYRWYHLGLVRGNVQLQLIPERNRAVIAAWRDVDAQWATLDDIYGSVVNGDTLPPDGLGRVIALTETVTSASTDVVAALRAAYAQDLGARGFGEALLLDLYERQRMLGQRIAKDVCMIARGDDQGDDRADDRADDSASRIKDLSTTIDRFDLSLDAFRTGLQDAGVPKPPTDQIARDLDAAKTAWQTASPVARATVAGDPLDPIALISFFDEMEAVNVTMTAAINALVARTE
ncbi:MAG: type IV pili methyl-accepting chemotaxis transducer N-terminal domain-containing protein [Pseudomonadota bacterium]